MIIEVIEVLATYGGIASVILGTPYLCLLGAIIVLWKDGKRDKERMMQIIENKVEQDAKLEAAFISLKDVIKAR